MVISKKFGSLESTKLERRGCVKKEIGIDQFSFSDIDSLLMFFLIYFLVCCFLLVEED